MLPGVRHVRRVRPNSLLVGFCRLEAEPCSHVNKLAMLVYDSGPNLITSLERCGDSNSLRAMVDAALSEHPEGQ